MTTCYIHTRPPNLGHFSPRLSSYVATMSSAAPTAPVEGIRGLGADL